MNWKAEETIITTHKLTNDRYCTESGRGKQPYVTTKSFLRSYPRADCGEKRLMEVNKKGISSK